MLAGERCRHELVEIMACARGPARAVMEGMRWVLMLSLMVGCAAGAEMRPRGKRNSLRIETLEKRMAAMEAEMHDLAVANRRLVQLLEEAKHPPPVPTAEPTSGMP